jgi:[acyl-carrier-protein] S-malonyltransferase
VVVSPGVPYYSNTDCIHPMTETKSQLAMVFPGQGSQAVGMLAELGAGHDILLETFREASEVLGYDLWALCQQGPAEDLNQTDRTQPAMLAAGVAVWRVWCAQDGARPVLMAGHSLGEYSALVCAGALDFAEAVALVAERGQRMQAAVPAGVGAMAAILGLEDAQVIELCRQAEEGEVVAAVNFNSPGQVVIAGNHAAVERAMALAKTAGAKRALPLPVSVPSHCSLMQPAAEAFAASLARVSLRAPEIPVLHNVDVQAHHDPDAIRAALAQQLYSPVRWVETIQAMGRQGIHHCLEMGPGKVLAGLNKRIDKSIETLPVYDPASLAAALAV